MISFPALKQAYEESTSYVGPAVENYGAIKKRHEEIREGSASLGLEERSKGQEPQAGHCDHDEREA